MISLHADFDMEEKYEVFSCSILRSGNVLGVRIVAQSCVIDCK